MAIWWIWEGKCEREILKRGWWIGIGWKWEGMGEKNPFGIKKNRIYDRVVPIIRFLKGGRLFEKSISVPRLYTDIT
jgi:hypothetical protein